MSTLWTAWLAYSIAVYAIISFTALLGWRKNLIPAQKAELPIHIFIPARNEANVIGGLLEDLTKQTLPQNEFCVIVVDDRSTDATVEIVEQYKSRLPIQLMRIEKLPEKVHGKLHAMHLATSGLTSGSVLFVDADCRVGSRWLEVMANNSGPGGCAGPVYELPRQKSLWREVLSLDQAAVTYPAMGLLARLIPITASTANMLLPVKAFRNGLWGRVGIEGTGEDGRILQAQAAVGKPMRAVIDVDAATLTTLAPTYRETASARRRWYQDALTYSLLVKLIQAGIALSLLGLGSALVALFFSGTLWAGLLTIAAKYLFDSIHYSENKKYFPFFTRRSWLVWVPLQPWLLLSYALMPKPKTTSGRGFASS